MGVSSEELLIIIPIVLASLCAAMVPLIVILTMVVRTRGQSKTQAFENIAERSTPGGDTDDR